MIFFFYFHCRNIHGGTANKNHTQKNRYCSCNMAVNNFTFFVILMQPDSCALFRIGIVLQIYISIQLFTCRLLVTLTDLYTYFLKQNSNSRKSKHRKNSQWNRIISELHASNIYTNIQEKA